MHFTITGNVTLTAFDRYGNVVERTQHQNTVTSGGLSYLRDYLAAANLITVQTPPTYICIGSGAQVGRFFWVGSGVDNRLGETWRTPIIQRDATGLSAILHGHIDTTDNNGQTMSTFGIIGGNLASDQIGTGTLIACVLRSPSVLKTPALAYDLDWVLTVSGKFT